MVYNNYCPPNYYNDFYSPVIYNDYWVRRRYRRFNNCGNLFFSLGFFVTRPYSYYDYARVGYNNPIIYGDDNYYRPPVVEEGGPAEPDAVTAESNVAAAPPLWTIAKNIIMIKTIIELLWVSIKSLIHNYL